MVKLVLVPQQHLLLAAAIAARCCFFFPLVFYRQLPACVTTKRSQIISPRLGSGKNSKIGAFLFFRTLENLRDSAASQR